MLLEAHTHTNIIIHLHKHTYAFVTHIHFIHINVTVHMAALILMAMKRVLWRQHKNHYEQMCVIFMGATKFTLFLAATSIWRLMEYKRTQNLQHIFERMK